MNIVLRPAARADLECIWLDTLHKRGMARADLYVAEINRRIEMAATMPGLGSEVFGLPVEYRKVRSGAHRVIYRTTSVKLIVVRVAHEREDVPDESEDSW